MDNPIEGELESVAEDHLNKVVNIGWPFGIEAKIVAVMNAEKTYRSPNDQMISMQTEHFAAKLAALQEMLDDFLFIYFECAEMPFLHKIWTVQENNLIAAYKIIFLKNRQKRP